MEVTKSHTYDAPISKVIDMFANNDAIVDRYSGMGHHEIEIRECELGADSLHIESSCVVDIDLPGFAKKVLSPTNTMVQTDTWQLDGDKWRGTFTVDVIGAPVEMKGRMSLTPDGEQTIHEVTIDMKVKVPLVGGKIADWVGKNEAPKTLDQEFAAGDSWLAAHA